MACENGNVADVLENELYIYERYETRFGRILECRVELKRGA
jgi:hypothetical protein